MKLTKKRKESITKHLNNIAKMGLNELIAFDRSLQEVKPDMDAVVWKWVNRGVVKQLDYLKDVDVQTGGAMAILSDMKTDEAKGYIS